MRRATTHLPLTFERLKGDPDHIENEGFSANMRRILHALRHAATTANRLGNHRRPDANPDPLARHAAHTRARHTFRMPVLVERGKPHGEAGWVSWREAA